jgi:hypothetical protein
MPDSVKKILNRVHAVAAPAGSMRSRSVSSCNLAVDRRWADTPGVANSLPGFHRLASRLPRDAAQGADTAVWLDAIGT